MENDKPLISVIMSVRNSEATVREAIDSILAQTYTNWEFIICNDASSDHTQEILEEYQKKYPKKFYLLKNETNKYLAYSLNRCLEHCKGTLVARMDGDDMSAPTRFEKEVQFLKEHPDYQVVGTAMQRFSSEGMANVDAKPATVDKYYLRKGVPFNHATVMTYLSVYKELEGYTVAPRTVQGQDLDLWFRFFSKGFSGANLTEPLYLVREDLNAIKRRTPKHRWNSYKTMQIGFSLLGFPKRWLVKPFLSTLFKSMIPYCMFKWYRDLQKKRYEARQTKG